MINSRIFLIQVRHTSSTSNLNYYQILEVPPSSSIKEIKLQFKKLSKKYHPDLNPNLSNEEKELLNNKFVSMVNAYDTLKDIKKKKQYDEEILGRQHPHHRSNRGFGSRRDANTEWHNQYYGEAKYYSRGGSQSSSSGSGLNSKRHRVYYDGNDFDPGSKFSGQHINYGDRFDVPHFDYNEHLQKHLKFEQRIINKHLSTEERDKILKNLKKSNENVSEELITKHLMRHVHHQNNTSTQSEPYTSTPNHSQQPFTKSSSSSNHNTRNPHMYYGPEYSSESNIGKTLIFLTGAGSSLFLLYKAVS
ncbi:uncharacterized protein RJT21DRAFT_121557 [Scheffersomyces amazonensis]|uniref:uncharacterized protein n=1 Tax=Scheffersomyces amazonensis TaxID=1078765 RepID=UPI00315D4B9A